MSRAPQKLSNHKDVQFFSVGTLNGRTLLIYMKKKAVSFPCSSSQVHFVSLYRSLTVSSMPWNPWLAKLLRSPKLLEPLADLSLVHSALTGSGHIA